MTGRTTSPLQQLWGWKVAGYLFGAGTGAGAYMVGAACRAFTSAYRPGDRFAMAAGLLLVLLSVPLLIWDLGRPLAFLQVLSRPRRSWLARGAWILTLFTLLAVLSLLTDPGPWLPLSGLVLGLGVATYTGLLLGSITVRPLWNNPILPLLFLCSALSAGLAIVLLLAPFAPFAASSLQALGVTLRPVHMAVLLLELLLLYVYLTVAATRSRFAVLNLIRGPLSLRFWGLVVAVGIVLPFLLELLTAIHGPAILEIAGRLLILAGGYSLRHLILLAGRPSQTEFLGLSLTSRPEV